MSSEIKDTGAKKGSWLLKNLSRYIQGVKSLPKYSSEILRYEKFISLRTLDLETRTLPIDHQGNKVHPWSNFYEYLWRPD